MSQPAYANTPSTFDTDDCSLVTADGTSAVVLLEPQPAAAAVNTLPPYYGGATLIDGTVSTTESANRDLVLWKGKVLTTQDTTATGAMSSTTSTLVRAAGSWITDKWRVGDPVMVFAPRTLAPNAALDGVLGSVTTVAALTLTVSGTPFAALSLAAGSRICKMSRLFTMAIPLNAGNTTAVPNVKLLNNVLDSSANIADRKLGATDLLAVSSGAALTASTTTTATVQYAKY